MNRFFRAIIPVFLTLTLSSPVGAEQSAAPPVKTVKPARGKFVSSIDLIGEITSRKQIYLASPFHSKLEMLAEDGQKVRKNEIIAKLSMKEAMEKLSEEKMKLEIAKNDLMLLEKNSAADLVKLDASVTLARKSVQLKELELKKLLAGAAAEELKKLKLNIDQTGKALSLARYNLEQKKKLQARGIASKKDILELELQIARAEKDNRLARAEYLLTEAGATETSKKIAALELEIEKNKLQVELENRQHKLNTSGLEKNKIRVKISGHQAKVSQYQSWIESATIRAPVDGTVIISKTWTSGGLAKVKVGDEVYRGRPFMSVANLEDAVIRSELEEQYVGKVKPGLSCNITVGNLKDKIFKGLVVKVGVLANDKKGEDRSEGQSKVFELDIDLTDKKNNNFKPGMSVDIKIILKTLDNVLLIPSNIIYKEGGKNYVFLAPGQKRYIRLGETGIDKSVVLEGLTEADMVIAEEETGEI